MNKKHDTTISDMTHKINDALMRSLARLDSDEVMKKNGYSEIERGNAISKTSQTLVNVLKTNIRIMELADKHNKTINEIKDELDR